MSFLWFEFMFKSFNKSEFYFMRLKEVKETLWMCNVHVLCFMYESTDPLEWVPIGCGMWKWFCGIHIDLNLKQVLYCFFLTNTISTRLRLHPMHICILNLFWFYGSLLSLSYIMALADCWNFGLARRRTRSRNAPHLDQLALPQIKQESHLSLTCSII